MSNVFRDDNLAAINQRDNSCMPAMSAATRLRGQVRRVQCRHDIRDAIIYVLDAPLDGHGNLARVSTELAALDRTDVGAVHFFIPIMKAR